jgi:hypothetical protein
MRERYGTRPIGARCPKLLILPPRAPWEEDRVNREITHIEVGDLFVIRHLVT